MYVTFFLFKLPTCFINSFKKQKCFLFLSVLKPPCYEQRERIQIFQIDIFSFFHFAVIQISDQRESEKMGPLKPETEMSGTAPKTIHCILMPMLMLLFLSLSLFYLFVVFLSFSISFISIYA